MARLIFNPAGQERFAKALLRLDPLAGEPLLRLMDPLSDARLHAGRGGLPWLRVTIVWLISVGPVVLFALLFPAGGSGSTSVGATGDRLPFLQDYATLTQYVILWFWLLLVVWARRVLGHLLIHLQGSGAVGAIEFSPPNSARHNPLLRFLESASRLTNWRALFWFLFMLGFNASQISPFMEKALNAPSAVSNATPGKSTIASTNSSPLVSLSTPDPTSSPPSRKAVYSASRSWWTSPATPGTFLYRFHNEGPGGRGEQPNAAGLYHFLMFSTLFGYGLILAIRLMVVFACLTHVLSRATSLRIVPTHPDCTGGLVAVGQVSLFLSLFMLLSGLFLAGYTIQNVLLTQAREQIFALVVLWLAYLLLAPPLFFIPLVPLRNAMLAAKVAYLRNADLLYRTVDQRHQDDLSAGRFDSGFAQGHTALASLILASEQMAVWPLDRVTLRRFAGLFLSPLLPLILGRIVPQLKPFFEALCR